jgi:hypothetical protein
LLPSSGKMKPKPLVGLNHLTVPIAIAASLSDANAAQQRAAGATGLGGLEGTRTDRSRSKSAKRRLPAERHQKAKEVSNATEIARQKGGPGGFHQSRPVTSGSWPTSRVGHRRSKGRSPARRLPGLQGGGVACPVSATAVKTRIWISPAENSIFGTPLTHG